MQKDKQSTAPGQEVSEHMKLYIKDADGNTLGEIDVPAGRKVPPTRVKNAESYSTKK